MPCQPEGVGVPNRPFWPFFDSVALRILSQPADLKLSDNVVAYVRRLADVKDELAKIGQN
jgi:hypothetical protein